MLVGDLIIAASALLLAERTVFIAKTVQRVDPVRLMMYQSIIGAAGLFLLSLIWDVDRPRAGRPACSCPSSTRERSSAVSTSC